MLKEETAPRHSCARYDVNVSYLRFAYSVAVCIARLHESAGSPPPILFPMYWDPRILPQCLYLVIQVHVLVSIHLQLHVSAQLGSVGPQGDAVFLAGVGSHLQDPRMG